MTSSGQVETRVVEGQIGETYRGDTESAVNDIAKRIRDGWRVVLVAEGKGTGERLAEVLTERELPVRSLAALDAIPEPGIGSIVTGELAHGFVAEPIKLAVFTAGDLSGQRVADKAIRKAARRRNQIDLLELTTATRRTAQPRGRPLRRDGAAQVAGSIREHLAIEYARPTRPAPRPALCADGLTRPGDPLRRRGDPTLDRMGGADWAKRKGRPARRSGDRRRADRAVRCPSADPGHAFPLTPPGSASWRPLQLRRAPDQLAAVEEVKRHMEQIAPMDRLICGDVGYGKTEIAVRASESDWNRLSGATWIGNPAYRSAKVA